MKKHDEKTDNNVEQWIELIRREISKKSVEQELPSYRIVKRDHGVNQKQEPQHGNMKRWSLGSSPWPLAMRKPIHYGPGVSVRSNLIKQLKEQQQLARIDRRLGWLRSLVSLLSNSQVFGVRSMAGELARSLSKHMEE